MPTDGETQVIGEILSYSLIADKLCIKLQRSFQDNEMLIKRKIS